MPRAWRAVVAACLLATACQDDDGATTTATTATATTASERVSVDPAGRPYDAELLEGTTTETRPLARLHVAEGRLRVLDGNALEVAPSSEDATAVDFAAEDLDVRIVWEVREAGGREHEVVLGVRVEVPGASVAAWGRFEPAYGTDGGVGAVTSQAVIDRAEARGFDGDPFIPEAEIDRTAAVQLFDLDGVPGSDSLVFGNGFGDGGFPMARGVDAGGQLVAVVVWHPRYPWRLAVPDGSPPPDVTEREDQLQACLDEQRCEAGP
jgi:hypothetical protein